MTQLGDLWWELEQLRQMRGACSCGDSTILGVIHSDTKPCSLPVVRMPLTDEQILKMAKDPETDIEFARSIEAVHGITGIRKL
jgi:hypothetical protein